MSSPSLATFICNRWLLFLSDLFQSVSCDRIRSKNYKSIEILPLEFILSKLSDFFLPGTVCSSRPCTTCAWAWGRWARSLYDYNSPLMSSCPWRFYCCSAQVRTGRQWALTDCYLFTTYPHLLTHATSASFLKAACEHKLDFIMESCYEIINPQIWFSQSKLWTSTGRLKLTG